MSTDIRFPDLRPCILCAYYATGEELVEPGRIEAPGIGKICGDCLDHAIQARNLIHATPGITRHMIPDGDRNTALQPNPKSTIRNPKS